MTLESKDNEWKWNFPAEPSSTATAAKAGVQRITARIPHAVPSSSLCVSGRERSGEERCFLPHSLSLSERESLVNHLAFLWPHSFAGACMHAACLSLRKREESREKRREDGGEESSGETQIRCEIKSSGIKLEIDILAATAFVCGHTHAHAHSHRHTDSHRR